MVTYAQFLALFLLPPLCVILIVARSLLTRRVALAIAVVWALALAYTGPWDNLIIVNGVWSYGVHQVSGLLIGHVPLEEFAFYVLQVAVTALFTVWLLHRWER